MIDLLASMFVAFVVFLPFYVVGLVLRRRQIKRYAELHPEWQPSTGAPLVFFGHGYGHVGSADGGSSSSCSSSGC